MMWEKMLCSYYVIKTRLVIILFAVAVLLSTWNILSALVTESCMFYLNQIKSWSVLTLQPTLYLFISS